MTIAAISGGALMFSLVVAGLVYRHLSDAIRAARDSADDAGRLAAKADQRAGEVHERLAALRKEIGADK